MGTFVPKKGDICPQMGTFVPTGDLVPSGDKCPTFGDKCPHWKMSPDEGSGYRYIDNCPYLGIDAPGDIWGHSGTFGDIWGHFDKQYFISDI